MLTNRIQFDSYDLHDFRFYRESQRNINVFYFFSAALECHFPNDQEELLRAASFGKCFTSDPSGAEKFASACRTLRVLNNIRDPQIGVPLTHQQYKALGFTSVVDRMILRNLWPLAVSICEHLQVHV